MTDEDYLRACGGWAQSEDGESGEVYWTHPRRPSVRSGWPRRFTLSEAVCVQTAEDRARLAFAQGRRASGEPAESGDSLWFEDRGDEQPTPYLYVGDRGEWCAFRMTPGKALAWARALTDFAEGHPVPGRPRGATDGPEWYDRREPIR